MISETAKRHAAAMAVTFEQRDAQFKAIRSQAIDDCIAIVKPFDVELASRLEALKDHSPVPQASEGKATHDFTEHVEWFLGGIRMPPGHFRLVRLGPVSKDEEIAF